jgi:hypothetical protein
MKIRLLLPCLTAALMAQTVQLSATPEAIEIGPNNLKDLPGGKEADGIIGDFVLRNDRVEAVISANLHLRRANMSTFYGENGITPGNLYDLTRRGENNDQIVVFTPSGQQGPVSYVRIASPGTTGEAVVETVVSAAMNNGLYKRHEYRLRDGWQGVLIVTTFRNESGEPRKGSVADRWTKFDSTGSFDGISWADSIDPSDKCGYAYDWFTDDRFKRPGREIELKPGQEVSFARFLAVGGSPAEALGEVAAFTGKKTARVQGRLNERSGDAIATGNIAFTRGKSSINAYPDKRGGFDLRLPAGDYAWQASDIGRGRTDSNRASLAPGAIFPVSAVLPPAAVVEFDIRDESGRGIPCKAQFRGINGTKTPNLGPGWRAHGCLDQYHSEKGQFRVQLDPGEYEVTVTHGIEFTHLRRQIKLLESGSVKFSGSLRRVVDTTGWVSADYHNHSTPSGDNVCGTDDRLINLAAEHIEFAPTTEHNRIYDWRPHIERLGLAEEIQTVSGLESTGGGAHMNTFPFKPVPRTQDGGAPVWEADPRINALRLREWQGREPARWIQINHPDMLANFTDRDGNGKFDGGFIGLGELIDGIETDNYSASTILGQAPYSVSLDRGRETVRFQRPFIWLQLLNQGAPYVAMAVCDAHRVHGNGVGGWRMYMPSKTDKPSEIDWRENSAHAKAGRSFLTTGPFLQVKTLDGKLPGETTTAKGSIDLKVKVQCTDWIDIDRVQVLVNGRQPKNLNFTRETHPQFFGDGVVKFDRTLTVPLKEDSLLIVVATGENSNLAIGYGSSAQAKIKPVAYHNPIRVDHDGNGFKPNGDTLGFALPTKGISPAEARAQLKAAGHE